MASVLSAAQKKRGQPLSRLRSHGQRLGMTRPSASELCEQLASPSADVVARALGEVRAWTRLHPSELGDYGDAIMIRASDERLRWTVALCTEGAIPRVLDAWTLAEKRDVHPLRILVFQVLAQILHLLSCHQPNHVHGDALLTTLLDPASPWMTHIQESVSRASQPTKRDKASADMIRLLLALRLCTAMAMYARGKYAQMVWERFHWTSEAHARMASMRRRAGAQAVSMRDMDVRTQYLAFVLAMLTQTYSTALKMVVLDIGTDAWQALCRGITSDPPDVVRFVLLVVHEEVCKDEQLARSVKAKFLGDVCPLLLGLYAREREEAGSTSVADVVHHFLLSTATHPGFGMCYADRGWYGRDGQDSDTLHNKMLLHLVRKLDVTNDLRQQELALRICEACPELVGPVLARTVIDVHADQTACYVHWAYVGRVLQLPVPALGALPPPRSTILAHTAPEPVCRAVAKALAPSHALLQYVACTVCACMLERMCAFRREALQAAQAAEEGPDGPWTRCAASLELAWRTRLPAIELVAPLMHKASAMQREAALRVLALYMEALPGTAFDTHWDAGSLLTRAFLDPPPTGLHWERVSQMHVLRMLMSASVDMLSKVPTPWPAHARRSYAHFVLVAYTRAPPALRAQCATLLRHWLGRTAVLTHDPTELDAWLVPLDDDADVLAFWDDCLVRCVRTPYRYAERIRELVGEHAAMSPLLAVVWEQAEIRLAKRLWTDAQAQRIVAYMARLCVELLRHGCAARPLRTLAHRIGDPIAAWMDAACVVPTRAVPHPVLQSRPATYARVADTLSAYDAPLMLQVWLERVHPAHEPDLVSCTWDALDRWAARHALAPSLQARVWEHATTRAWLESEDATYLVRLVAFLCTMPSARLLRRVVDVVVERAARAPTPWLATLARLAPYASEAHLVTLLRAWPPPAEASEAQLQTLAQLVPHTGTEALRVLHTHIASLMQRASDAACDVLDAVLDATLPPGLDPFTPPTHGSLAALAHARTYVPRALPILRDTTAARAMYAAASAPPPGPWGPYTTLAALEGPHACASPPVASLVPACLHDPLACATVAAAYALDAASWDAALDAALRGASLATFCAPHVAWLVHACGSDRLQAALVDVGLRFLTRRMAEDAHDAPRTVAWTRALRRVVRRVPTSLAEPMLEAIVHHRATDTDAIRLALAVARACTLRSSVAERLLHALVAQTDVVYAATHTPAFRRPCVALLVRLVQRDSLATPTTLARLVYLYRGTTDACDAALWAVLERGTRDGAWAAAWSADKQAVPTSLPLASCLTALLSLQPTASYDPWLVLNLVGGAILERETHDAYLTGLEWLAILRTGAMGRVVTCLSTHRAALRLYAMRVLGKVYASLQPTAFREKELVLLVLERVRDALPPPPPTSVAGTYDEVPWLPSMTTMLAAHALRLVATPHASAFPDVCRYLLQRPRLDVLDVPMLYRSLHSTHDSWAAQRAWILRFLHDAWQAHASVADTQHPRGLQRARTEWSMFKRRHVWDLVLSMYGPMLSSGAAADHRFAQQLEDVMLAAAAIPHVAQDLITRRGLLGWITLRIASERPTSERAVFWYTWLWKLCAPPSLPPHATLARLERLDHQLDGALVPAVLLPATHLVRTAPWTDACARPALALLAVLVEYAALQDTTTCRDLRPCLAVLTPLVSWLRTHPDRDLHSTALRCTLLLSDAGAPPSHTRRLFALLRLDQVPATRPWAAAALRSLHL